MKYGDYVLLLEGVEACRVNLHNFPILDLKRYTKVSKFLSGEKGKTKINKIEGLTQ